MFSLALLYITLGFAGLVALATMILRIGTLLGDCPQSRATARAGAVTIATGFCAIGAGGVILIGAALQLFEHAPFASFLGALGLRPSASGLALPKRSGHCVP